MMASKKELEALHPTTLAVLCDRLANSNSDPTTVAKGRELKKEWVRLQTPPSLNWKEEREEALGPPQTDGGFSRRPRRG
jgi:hypothetical protein